MVSFSDLLRSIQDVIDRKCPISYIDGDSSSGSDDSESECTPTIDNSNNRKADQELAILESYKRKKYRPILDRSNSRIISGVDHEGKLREILVGPVLQPGKDLPSGKNLATYISAKGYFSLVDFFMDHKKVFPSLWIIVQCESARSAVEVGCERFFSVSGYVSAPRRTRLGVRTYERLALMSVILNTIYIDKKWVAKEYLRRCKEGAWSEERTEEALKCWNLERVIEAELMGKLEPEELTMEELIKEGQV